MKTMMLPAVGAVVLMGGLVHADEVRLVSGGRLVGIVREAGDWIRVETDHGMVGVPRKQVLSIDRTHRCAYEDLLDMIEAADLEEIDDLVRLGAWAARNKLPAQSRRMYRMVLELDPDHRIARHGLGHRFCHGRWMTKSEYRKALGLVRYNGKWMTASERALLIRETKARTRRKGETVVE